MDHFESIVATLLEADGYWVRRSFKVNLTKDEKRQIGKPSIPRPEIDLLALHAGRNEVIAFEAKSFLDSTGVKLEHLQMEHGAPEGRYKLFTSQTYRTIVLGRLQQDLVKLGMATAGTRIRLGLAAGNVNQYRSTEMRAFMTSRDWVFWSPEDIKQKVTALAARGYENDAAIITTKILLK